MAMVMDISTGEDVNELPEEYAACLRYAMFLANREGLPIVIITENHQGALTSVKPDNLSEAWYIGALAVMSENA